MWNTNFSHQEATWGNCQPQLEKSLEVGMKVCCEFTRASVKINSKEEAELFFFLLLFKKNFFFPISFVLCGLWNLSSLNRD